MTISNKSNQNRISTTTSTPISETDKNTDKPTTIRVAQKVKGQIDINPPKQQSKQIDLSSVATTKVAKPKTFVNQQTSTVSKTSNIDTFYKDIATITDETEKELTQMIKTPTKKVSKRQRLVINIISGIFSAIVAAYTIAVIVLLIIPGLQPVGMLLGFVAVASCVVVCGADTLLNSIRLSQLDKMASSHKTASLTADIFNNDEVKEKLKENPNYKDVDFNLVTENVKKSLKNPKVLTAMHNLVDKARTAFVNEKDNKIEKKLVENTEAFLDVFFAAVDESLTGKEKSFIQNAKKEYLKAFIETDPQKFRDTVFKIMNDSEVLKMANMSIPARNIFKDGATKGLESIRRGMGNYLQKHFDQDTRL